VIADYHVFLLAALGFYGLSFVAFKLIPTVRCFYFLNAVIYQGVSLYLWFHS